ncbi:MAG: acyltransferase family protein [Candidatus Bipolaricaulota bacterium]|nr:acyltransferase family protein [Candidatus Bipolaricaulota bacterium]
MTESKRLFCLDNLRVALTMLLVAHHVGQAYGPTGGAWPIQEASRAAILGPLFTIDRSFFMSLFFLISGFFSAASYDAKGGRAFVRSRLLRLGLPVLVWALLMIPLQIFVFGAPGGGAKAWPIDVGHLWFLEHLLLFSLVYALWRRIRGSRTPAVVTEARPPRTLAILIFALLLAPVSGVIRIPFPIDRWVYVLGFFRVAFADVPRDLAFFVLGLVAYRRQWLSGFSSRAGRAWLAVAVLLAALIAVYDLGLHDIVPIGEPVWGILYVAWESIFCCAACIGLLVLFRDRVTAHGRLARALSQSQYAAYIVHVPVILAFQCTALQLTLPPLAKFVLVTIVSIPATFAVACAVRRPLHL